MQPDHVLDIRGDNCPMTFVRTKLQIEKMQRGEVLKVTMNDGEPAENVPRAVLDHGHEILALDRPGGDVVELLIRIA